MGLPNSSPFLEIPKVSLLRRLRSDAPPVAALYGILDDCLWGKKSMNPSLFATRLFRKATA